MHSGVCETRQDAGLPVIHSAISDSGRLRTRGGQPDLRPAFLPTVFERWDLAGDWLSGVERPLLSSDADASGAWLLKGVASQRPAHSVSIFRLLLKIAVGLPRSCDCCQFLRDFGPNAQGTSSCALAAWRGTWPNLATPHGPQPSPASRQAVVWSTPPFRAVELIPSRPFGYDQV